MKKEDYDCAIKFFSQALGDLENDLRNQQVVLFSRAQAYYGKTDYSQAWRDLNQLHSTGNLDPETSALALNLRGLLQHKKGLENAAIQDLTHAIKIPHGKVEIRASSFAKRGMVYLNVGNLGSALSDFNKAIELDADYAYAFAGRSLVLLRMDKLDGAKRDAKLALSLNPDKTAVRIAETVLKEMEGFKQSPQLVTVPIADSGHIYVQLRFGRSGKPHRFLLDTGATHSLVSRELFNEIKKETDVEPLGTTKVKIADGTVHTVARHKVKNAFLFGLPIGEMEIHTFERGGSGFEITNLFGVQACKNISIKMDYAKKQVDIMRKSSFD